LRLPAEDSIVDALVDGSQDPGDKCYQHQAKQESITMAELISVTTTDGQTEIVNLDYVVRIEAHGRQNSAITIATSLLPLLAMPMLVKGTPSDIASAHRIHGK
jgi:hypothetical protein